VQSTSLPLLLGLNAPNSALKMIKDLTLNRDKVSPLRVHNFVSADSPTQNNNSIKPSFTGDEQNIQYS